uniref:Mitochondria-eating protein n=1 Tax=Saccoglossus kowalevskii TaxID=10224 RepID=A0ABM0MHR8_SACKO|nr:PREDICTED: uncharacterized protein LOC102809050 [Saccoglossus kowalevskii]
MTDDIKSKLLFSVIVLAFRFSQNEIEEMMSKVIEAVNIPNTGVSAQISTHSVYVKEMECLTTNYLYRTAKQYDLNNVIEKVSEQLFSTLHDYPSLRMSSGIKSFIGTCVRVAWQLSTHSPPYILDYDHKDFNDQLHQRFHRNDTNKKIKGYLWPALLDATTLKCVHKGIVITEKSESDDELCDTKL